MRYSIKGQKIHDSKMEKAVKSIRIKGYKYLGHGIADFNGHRIDLTATAPEHLAIAYTTLSQIKV